MIRKLIKHSSSFLESLNFLIVCPNLAVLCLGLEGTMLIVTAGYEMLVATTTRAIKTC